MFTLPQPLILASSSASRKMLLKRLQIDFDCISPDIDETALQGESPAQLAERLALEKARAVKHIANAHFIISSDQVAVCEGRIMNKPLSIPTALEQLRYQSGKKTEFYTSLCLYNSSNSTYQLGLDTFNVTFRHLTDEDIEYTVAQDRPLHCAGSFKSESLGVTLFEKMQGNDPNTLIGLPLILLTTFLKNSQNTSLPVDS